MNGKMLLFLPFFTNGCHLLGDKVEPSYQAGVDIVDNKICVTVPIHLEEVVSFIVIEEAGNRHNRIFIPFDELNDPYRPVANQCLTTEGFNFEKEKTYHYTVMLDAPDKKIPAFFDELYIF
ncbi:putative T6SS immunity periplasmic lipoprotein [Acerihabitans sp. KWT182]|uniref:T6SS immunity periplasmic lipoprotein n=1 Tax=Acerihabitans sp. KWT182 TaxID=3157919 RepID=A0AAU7Q925_9GAMM